MSGPGCSLREPRLVRRRARVTKHGKNRRIQSAVCICENGTNVLDSSRRRSTNRRSERGIRRTPRSRRLYACPGSRATLNTRLLMHLQRDADNRVGLAWREPHTKEIILGCSHRNAACPVRTAERRASAIPRQTYHPVVQVGVPHRFRDWRTQWERRWVDRYGRDRV